MVPLHVVPLHVVPLLKRLCSCALLCIKGLNVWQPATFEILSIVFSSTCLAHTKNESKHLYYNVCSVCTLDSKQIVDKALGQIGSCPLMRHIERGIDMINTQYSYLLAVRLKEIDGQLLAELVSMRFVSPDVYYDVMRQEHGMLMIDLLRLNAAIRRLANQWWLMDCGHLLCS